MNKLVRACCACAAFAASGSGEVSWAAEVKLQRPDATESAGIIADGAFPSSAASGRTAYLVYLPAGYDAAASARFPVVYLLHGRGDAMSAWGAMKPDLDRLIAAGKIPALIALMPDAPSSRRAGYYIDSQFTGAAGLPAGEPVETIFTTELVAHVDAHFRTQPERRARIVAGYSMGGYGALRYALGHPATFGAAIVLSPAVYFPLPPRASSTREFGAFGRGSKIFDEGIYREKNYPALQPAFEAARLPLAMFIAVGDREMALADPAEASHDLDYEAHTLYNKIRRVPGITAQLRVLDGGHNWDVWRPAFVEGVQQVFRPTATPRGPAEPRR